MGMLLQISSILTIPPGGASREFRILVSASSSAWSPLGRLSAASLGRVLESGLAPPNPKNRLDGGGTNSAFVSGWPLGFKPVVPFASLLKAFRRIRMMVRTAIASITAPDIEIARTDFSGKRSPPVEEAGTMGVSSCRFEKDLCTKDGRIEIGDAVVRAIRAKRQTGRKPSVEGENIGIVCARAKRSLCVLCRLLEDGQTQYVHAQVLRYCPID